jgi:hypothetical protein
MITKLSGNISCTQKWRLKIALENASWFRSWLWCELWHHLSELAIDGSDKSDTTVF